MTTEPRNSRVAAYVTGGGDYSNVQAIDRDVAKIDALGAQRH